MQILLMTREIFMLEIIRYRHYDARSMQAFCIPRHAIYGIAYHLADMRLRDYASPPIVGDITFLAFATGFASFFSLLGIAAFISALQGQLSLGAARLNEFSISLFSSRLRYITPCVFSSFSLLTRPHALLTTKKR